MALSEREQRLLEEMERNLYNSESDVVSTAGASRVRPSYRSLVLGILLTVVGIIILLVGVMTSLTWLGVIGFAAMLGGVIYAISPHKGSPRSLREEAPGASSHASARAATPKQSFADRMSDRWEKRQDGGL
ncbi:DUF3040 family protein [Klugiella xanthotipulae]|uniref:DUF3040 family protein n=2 Tax=Klugiella xanthotipulae TaxID=244735 RepID=A0A543HT85_9MICO|nr:DUF3040 family protein [Klugiella xanthotipulae]